MDSAFKGPLSLKLKEACSMLLNCLVSRFFAVHSIRGSMLPTAKMVHKRTNVTSILK